ncbi:MAG: Ig domain-containing protein [Balneolales bacterium]
MNPKILLSLIILISFSIITLQAQPQIIKDYDGLMEIPDIITIDSSPAHLYVLSDNEGLAVFRTSTNGLQYLSTSENMQRRGNIIKSDIRYGYLFGNDNWLTVLDPTTVPGIYSSTRLPSQPDDVTRIGDYLYVALHDDGLGRISLKTAESVDDSVSMVFPLEETRARIAGLASRPGQLFVLTENSRLFYFEVENDRLELQNDFNLSERVNKIFSFDDELLTSNSRGEVFSIHPDGSLQRLFTVETAIEKIEIWQDYLVIHDNRQRVWLQKGNEEPVLYRSDSDSKNYFTVSKNQLWMTEYDQISRLYTLADSEQTETAQNTSSGTSLDISEIDNMVIPYPQPLLLSLGLDSEHDMNEVKFQYRSRIENANIHNQGLYWQPGSSDTGIHNFTILASTKDGQTDSTSFTVDIRSFNSPPRFTPVRPVSIAVDESFTLPFKAVDPDGIDGELVRYIGVDIPQGATLEENTGRFNWTPNRRQAGDHDFQIIATDQFGAAASQNINITVKEIERE